MDLKKFRRDAASGLDVEGMYPGANGNPNKKGQGSAASDNNIGYDVRAMSWARGADTDYMAIEREKNENDKRFGVPCEDNFPAPSDPKGPKNLGAKYQTASYDANDTLPSPHNFSNNPGFMGTSTGEMATLGNPAGSGSDLRMAMRGGPAARTVTPGAGPTRAGRSLPGIPFAGTGRY